MDLSQKFVNKIRKMNETVNVCVKSMKSMSEFFKSYVGLKQGEPLLALTKRTTLAFTCIIFIYDMAKDLLSNGIYFSNIRAAICRRRCTICQHFRRIANVFGQSSRILLQMEY